MNSTHRKISPSQRRVWMNSNYTGKHHQDTNNNGISFTSKNLDCETSRSSIHTEVNTDNFKYIKKPLISNDVLDIPTQRIVMLSIFTIIQAYKLYDLILLKTGLPVTGLLLTNSRFNFISKYVLIDSLFLYFLPSFKIPKLTFRPVVVLIQILLVTSTTVILSNDQSFPVISLLVGIWTRATTKELSLTGGSVNHRKVLDSSNHFKGAHTIKILPENTGMLNPFHDSFCLPMDETAISLEIPIRINSTSAIEFIQLEFRDLYTNNVELWNLTNNDLTKNVIYGNNEDKIRYFNLPLNKVGFYELKKIVDENKFSLRLYRSQLIISHCPIAIISGKGTKDRCVGDSDEVNIQVSGVPPLQLRYTKKINDQIYSFTDSSLQPEYFESPLLSNSKFYSQKYVEDLKWARIYSVNVDLQSNIHELGEYSYSVDQIVDGLGNVIDFSQTNPKLLEKYGLTYNFIGHDLPHVYLDDKFNSKSVTKRSILLKVENTNTDTPYVAKFRFQNDKGKIESFYHTFDNSNEEILVENPGTYILESVQSKVCPGIIAGKSRILITRPVPPQVSIKSSPIIDQCVGQVGLNFDLTFTGVPPFYYNAKIFKLEDGEYKLHDIKKFTSSGTRNQFSYSPIIEGHYEIVFDKLSNTLFTDEINLKPVSDYTFKTSMRVKPGAKIKFQHDVRLCLGGQNKVPLEFTGEPPFSLSYDILETSTNSRASYTLEDISSHHYEIITPKFEIGGDYIVSLISVTDSSGCIVGLSGSDLKIQVRRDVPSVLFNLLDSSNEIKITEGSVAELPLRLSGESPFTVKYQHLDHNGDILGNFETKFSSIYKTSLKVTKEGSYKLLSVNDQTCEGRISEHDTFHVKFLEKPSFIVSEHNKMSKIKNNYFVKEPVCKNIEESFDLLLKGSPPFVVNYELLLPNGQITTKSIQVATKYASLKLPNDQHGDYIITIKGLYDSHYTEKKLAKINFKNQVVNIKQTVKPLPMVEFFEKGKIYRTCLANIDQPALLDRIPLRFLDGEGPFSISFSIYHESTSKTDYLTLGNVTHDTFDFKKLYKDLKLGNHIVTIEKVIDANYCICEKISEKNHILITITDVPKISLLDPSIEYCVGDYVAYQLGGMAPFTIKYRFNDIPLKSVEPSFQFVRVASDPGTISIESIQDFSSQCTVNFTKEGMESEYEKLSLIIHPIPSVTVSQGDWVVEDIHEGDQAEVIFSFEGTPPFSLTYIRSEETENGQGKRKFDVIETHKVSDIYAYEYRVVTSLQGTYEAIEVSDAFCSAQNNAYF